MRSRKVWEGKMETSKKSSELKRGLIVFLGLAVLTAVEYMVGITIYRSFCCGSLPWLKPAWLSGSSCIYPLSGRRRP